MNVKFEPTPFEERSYGTPPATLLTSTAIEELARAAQTHDVSISIYIRPVEPDDEDDEDGGDES